MVKQTEIYPYQGTQLSQKEETIDKTTTMDLEGLMLSENS